MAWHGMACRCRRDEEFGDRTGGHESGVDQRKQTGGDHLVGQASPRTFVDQVVCYRHASCSRSSSPTTETSPDVHLARCPSRQVGPTGRLGSHLAQRAVDRFDLGSRPVSRLGCLELFVVDVDDRAHSTPRVDIKTLASVISDVTDRTFAGFSNPRTHR
jgi:hypothetical protein